MSVGAFIVKDYIRCVISDVWWLAFGQRTRQWFLKGGCCLLDQGCC